MRGRSDYDCCSRIKLNKLPRFCNPREDNLEDKTIELSKERLQLFHSAHGIENDAVKFEDYSFSKFKNSLSITFFKCESQEKRALRAIYRQIRSLSMEKTPQKVLEKLDCISKFAVEPDIFLKAVSFVKVQSPSSSTGKNGYRLKIDAFTFQEGTFLEADAQEAQALFTENTSAQEEYKLKKANHTQYKQSVADLVDLKVKAKIDEQDTPQEPFQAFKILTDISLLKNEGNFLETISFIPVPGARDEFYIKIGNVVYSEKPFLKASQSEIGEFFIEGDIGELRLNSIGKALSLEDNSPILLDAFPGINSDELAGADPLNLNQTHKFPYLTRNS